MPITKKDQAQHVILKEAVDYLDDLRNDGADASHCIAKLESIYQDGFDVNKIYFAGDFNNTPLLWEISYGKAIKPAGALAMLQILKADPFLADKDGKNALHFLLLKGHEVQRCIVDEILTHEDVIEHINDQTTQGDTALHIACARRDENLIIQLIEKGADLNIENKNGKTPADMLRLTEEEIKKFISSYLDSEDDLEYVATIDSNVFNLNPEAIEKKMKEAFKHPLPSQPQPQSSILNKK
jgi:ankyrin repeat protein